MEILGYVVSSRKIKDLPNFVGLVSNVSEINSAKPFIIVGYKEAKDYFGESFNILNKNPEEGKFWTFLKTEKKNDFENDLNSFYSYILDVLVANIRYYYVNILNIRYNKLKSLIEIVKSSDRKYIYISGNMIYILYNRNVLGVSLTMINYAGISSKKVFNLLYRNKSNIIDSNIVFDNKIKSAIKNKKYVIPYFMSLNN